MSERQLIDKAIIAEEVMNVIEEHLDHEDLDFDDILYDVIVVQFEDAIMRIYLSYDKQDNAYFVETVELKDGDEIMQYNQNLRYLVSSVYVYQ